MTVAPLMLLAVLSPAPLTPLEAAVAAVIIGSWLGLTLALLEELRPRDLGSLGADWWVDRARKGGGR